MKVIKFGELDDVCRFVKENLESVCEGKVENGEGCLVLLWFFNCGMKFKKMCVIKVRLGSVVVLSVDGVYCGLDYYM